ncbi:MAG: hypothetical protein DUW69_002524, partial [Verrucomicrobia bacterium]
AAFLGKFCQSSPGPYYPRSVTTVQELSRRVVKSTASPTTTTAPRGSRHDRTVGHRLVPDPAGNKT